MQTAAEIRAPGFYWYYVSPESSPSLVEVMDPPVRGARFAGDTRLVPMSALSGFLAGPLALRRPARDG